ncbi:MAG: MdtA/MuxA family multidrug efflux RND transporter periplasmic adaptor subunit [Tatlockia sp.]|nr:MdtA/MuxA family multidrug efflux RND transporter periplasmic adaptor subunit [Tatlockia sp.]
MTEPLVSENFTPNPANKPKRRALWGWLFLLLLIILCLFFIKNRSSKPLENKKPVTVSLAVVEQQNVPVYLTAIGNVKAIYTVTVKTQINGLLMKVLYQEGQLVKKGDLLAEIDERPLLAQLTQYQGQLLRDQALLANANIDLKRYQKLWQQDSVAQQTLATQESLVKQYQGAVAIDEGLIQSTRVNLIYTRIISPIDGRLGLRLVDPGNFVQTSDTTGIVVVTTLNPISVIFTLPEDEVPKILPQALADKTIKVEALDRQQNKLLAEGQLLTIDNQIDTTTGTVKLRAIFDNKKNTLFANQFVNIRVLVSTLKNATLVPTAAIQRSSQGDFVFVLQPDFRVGVQPVKTGVTYGDNTVILQGLTRGQQVVVSGADQLVKGTKVKIAENHSSGKKNAEISK